MRAPPHAARQPRAPRRAASAGRRSASAGASSSARERRIRARREVAALELLDRRDQRLGHEAPAVGAEVAARVGIAPAERSVASASCCLSCVIVECACARVRDEARACACAILDAGRRLRRPTRRRRRTAAPCAIASRDVVGRQAAGQHDAPRCARAPRPRVQSTVRPVPPRRTGSARIEQQRRAGRPRRRPRPRPSPSADRLEHRASQRRGIAGGLVAVQLHRARARRLDDAADARPPARFDEHADRRHERRQRARRSRAPRPASMARGLSGQNTKPERRRRPAATAAAASSVARDAADLRSRSSRGSRRWPRTPHQLARAPRRDPASVMKRSPIRNAR